MQHMLAVLYLQTWGFWILNTHFLLFRQKNKYQKSTLIQPVHKLNKNLAVDLTVFKVHLCRGDC